MDLRPPPHPSYLSSLKSWLDDLYIFLQSLFRYDRQVSPYEVDHGAAGQGFSLYDILTNIGTTTKATVVFKRAGTYTVSSRFNASSYTNVYFQFEPGAILSVADLGTWSASSGLTWNQLSSSLATGIWTDVLNTLILPSPGHIIASPTQQIFSGAGTVSFAKTGIRYPEWYGAKGDDSTDDANAVSLAVGSGGGTVVFTNTYLIDTSKTMTLTDDVELRFDGDATLHIADTKGLTLDVPARLSTTLAADVTAGDYDITLTSVAGVEVGDLIKISSDTVAETLWNYTKYDVTSITAIAGAVVTLRDPARFAYTTAEAGQAVRITAPLKVKIVNMKMVNDATALENKFRIQYAKPTILGITQDNGTNAYGMTMTGCVDGEVSDARIRNGVYAFLLNYCNNIRFRNLSGEHCRHIVVPAYFSQYIYVDGVSGSGGLIESHPSFDVHYSNAHFTSGTVADNWNLRSIGGSIKDSRIRYTGALPASTYFQNIALIDATPYETAVFTLDNVEIIAGAAFSLVVENSYWMYFRNLKFPSGSTVRLGTSTVGNKTQNVFVDNVYGIDSIMTRQLDTTIQNTRSQFDAVFDGTNYNIYPWSATRINRKLKQHGVVFLESTTHPTVISLRIYTDWNTNVFSYYAYFTLRLIAQVRHDSAGFFDIEDKTYHFWHKKVLASRVEYGATPAWDNADTGIANEDCTIAIANVTQYGTTEGATQGSHFYVEMDVTINSGNTSPVYQLMYELEMWQENT